MRTPDLTGLNDAVRRAREEQYAPSSGEGSVGRVLPLPFIVEHREGAVLWRTIAQLRRHAPEVYDRYLGERFLAEIVVDIVANSEEAIDWTTLTAVLERRAVEEGEWLVAVPIANLVSAEGYVPIADGVGLGMTIQERDWHGSRKQPFSLFEIFDHLQDKLSAGVRWRHEEQRLGPLDTRKTAALFLVERGTQTIALSVARTRARYALSVWCLLRPPEIGELHPALADWEPRPYLEAALDHKLYEPGAWTGGSRVHGRSVTEHGEYQLPTDPRHLPAPFSAIELAPHRLSARAILGSAWHLYLVEREPNDLERTDQLLLLSTAIESLCDVGAGPTHGSEKRWSRVTERYGVWRDMRANYDQGELEEAKRLFRDLRNISAHGADSVLVNLGYPPAGKRRLPGGREVMGSELALARAAAVVPVLHHAVKTVAARMAHELVDRDFDDAWFVSQFDRTS